MNEETTVPKREPSPEEKIVVLAKQARAQVDGLLKGIDAHLLRKSIAGREFSLAYTKLQETRFWLGKCCEVAGNPLPEQYRDHASGPTF